MSLYLHTCGVQEAITHISCLACTSIGSCVSLSIWKRISGEANVNALKVNIVRNQHYLLTFDSVKRN